MKNHFILGGDVDEKSRNLSIHLKLPHKFHLLSDMK
jgi:hypothetical protein